MKLKPIFLITSGFLCGLAILALIIPFFSQFDPDTFNPELLGAASGPNRHHLFGTDELGRDILIRCIYGSRISLSVGIIAMSISIVIGTLYGLFAGYFGGYIDEFMMRIADIFMALPTLFIILIIQSLIPPNITNIMIIIGLFGWMGVARLVRAEVLRLKEHPFVIALKAKGLKNRWILFKHILPHTRNPIIVAAMLGMGNAILIESVLSYLGLGVQPPQASWGNMLQNSLHYMREAPWITFFPGILITLTVLSLNYIGDTIRSSLDPKEIQ